MDDPKLCFQEERKEKSRKFKFLVNSQFAKENQISRDFPLERPINPPIIPKPVNPVINGNIIDWQQQSLSKISDLQQNRHRYCHFYVVKLHVNVNSQGQQTYGK